MDKIKHYTKILGEASLYFVLFFLTFKILVWIYAILVFSFAPRDLVLGLGLFYLPIAFSILVTHKISLILIFGYILFRLIKFYSGYQVLEVGKRTITGFIMLVLFLSGSFYNRNQDEFYRNDELFLVNWVGLYTQEQKQTGKLTYKAEKLDSLKYCLEIKDISLIDDCYEKVMPKMSTTEECYLLSGKYSYYDYTGCFAHVAYNTNNYSLCENIPPTEYEADTKKISYECYFGIREIIGNKYIRVIDYSRGILSQYQAFNLDKEQAELMCRRLDELYFINWPDDEITRESRNKFCYGDKK